MRFLLPLALLGTAFAQQPKCENVKAALAHPVDDYITEINKEKSKRAHRNKNPLPSGICVFGLCAGTTPQNDPKPRAPEPQPVPAPQPQSSDPDTSTSKQTRVPGAVPVEAECPEFAHQPIEAAQNADVGDFYFKQKNYRAALSRYKEADGQKPGDPAIALRLGRAYEKLGQTDDARRHYQAAADAQEGFWTAEAKQALARVPVSN